MGGTDDEENLVTACRTCNLGKGARMVRASLRGRREHMRLDLAKDARAQDEFFRVPVQCRDRSALVLAGDFATRWAAMWGGGHFDNSGYLHVQGGFPADSRVISAVSNNPPCILDEAAAATHKRFGGEHHGRPTIDHFWLRVRKAWADCWSYG